MCSLSPSKAPKSVKGHFLSHMTGPPPIYPCSCHGFSMSWSETIGPVPLPHCTISALKSGTSTSHKGHQHRWDADADREADACDRDMWSWASSSNYYYSIWARELQAIQTGSMASHHTAVDVSKCSWRTTKRSQAHSRRQLNVSAVFNACMLVAMAVLYAHFGRS